MSRLAFELPTFPTLSADAQAPARALVSDLAGSSSGIGADMAAYIHTRIPELGASPDERALRMETESSCISNIDQILRLLGRGARADELVIPPPALDYAQGLVHRHVPLAVLLRAYHVGQAHLSGVTSRVLREGIEDEEIRLSSIEASSAFMFDYIDGICDQLVAAYQVERDRWVRTTAVVRTETVRGILDGVVDSERAASARLGYDLTRHHVGLILAGEPTRRRNGAVGSLEREAIEAAAVLGCQDPLLVTAGAAALWAWCGTVRQPGPDALTRLEAHRPSEGVRMAVGRPARGIDGFRITHVEAGHAARFWTFAGNRNSTTTYRAVEVVSLLASDLDRARRFVTAHLGPLAEDSDAAAGLRSTVLAFLALGCSHTRAAEALHMHHNTVYNRVRRAEELLGGPLIERGIEIQNALLLAETLGSEVLVPTSA